MLKKIYFAFKTAKYRHAGTKDQPVLIISDNTRDLLHHNFKTEGPIEEGSAHLLSVDVEKLNLNRYPRYMRVGLRGADMWRPELVFVFAELVNENYHYSPLGIKYYSPPISADESEGRLSIPLTRANFGGNFTRLRRLLVLIRNETKTGAGTNRPITLSIDSHAKNIASHKIPAGALAKNGGIYLSMVYLSENFIQNDIRDIEIRINGSDKWTPASFWLWGLDERQDNYENMVPLVAIPDWQSSDLGALSEDEKEGTASKLLYKAFL